MIIFYAADTLQQTHLILAADQSFHDFIRRADYPEPWIEIDTFVAPSNLRLSREAGAVVVDDVTDPAAPRRITAAARQAQLDPALADQAVEVGATVAWPLPEGAHVSIGGQLVDVMDGSGTYEFQPATAGTYRVLVQAAGYYDRSFAVEAHARS